MRVSDLIDELKHELEFYGDHEVIFSHNKQDMICRVTNVTGFVDGYDDDNRISNENIIMINGR